MPVMPSYTKSQWTPRLVHVESKCSPFIENTSFVSACSYYRAVKTEKKIDHLMVVITHLKIKSERYYARYWCRHATQPHNFGERLLLFLQVGMLDVDRQYLLCNTQLLCTAVVVDKNFV